jgi:hypothetical protein
MGGGRPIAARVPRGAWKASGGSEDVPPARCAPRAPAVPKERSRTSSSSSARTSNTAPARGIDDLGADRHAGGPCSLNGSNGFVPFQSVNATNSRPTPGRVQRGAIDLGAALSPVAALVGAAQTRVHLCPKECLSSAGMARGAGLGCPSTRSRRARRPPSLPHSSSARRSARAPARPR